LPGYCPGDPGGGFSEKDAAFEEGGSMKEEIRRPAVAGSFYPADSATLARQVRELLNRASKEEIPGKIVALVSPHAGYLYSGQVAAQAFKLVEGADFETVIVVAPSHRVFFQGASVYDRGGFETPLGTVSVDKDLCRKIMAESEILRFLPQGHSQEHSLEVQLPFLQGALGKFSLAPIVIGDQSFATCQKVGQAIAQGAKGKNVLLVASTDLSHFHSYDRAVKIDQVLLEDIRAYDPEKLQQDLQEEKAEACGGGPVIAVMIASRELGANESRVLSYRNSGDVTGDRSGVVGYAAAVFYRNPGAAEKAGARKKAGISLGLQEEEKKALRRIALAAIEGKLKGVRSAPAEKLGSNLQEKRGAFVSLHKSGRLRGCIGQIVPTKPLQQTIADMAVAAAFDDPRFDPLTLREMKDLELEISVLTPMERLKNPDEIEIGRHGLYLKKGFCSGLLLPQVAVEYGWDRNTFLEETCRKAGLSRGAWKEKGTEIYIFSADIF
jgi:AmmeMemoRadiSam system protein B/AmmeMemoRadiSam system protein A